MSTTGSLADPVRHKQSDRIIGGAPHDPHAVLGAHLIADGVIIRALRPLAESVTAVLADGRRFPMSHAYHGVFSAALPEPGIPDYRLAVSSAGAAGEIISHDPHRDPPPLRQID